MLSNMLWGDVDPKGGRTRDAIDIVNELCDCFDNDGDSRSLYNDECKEAIFLVALCDKKTYKRFQKSSDIFFAKQIAKQIAEQKLEPVELPRPTE